MSVFELHPRLAADTIAVSRLPLCEVLLMNDAQYPWLVLVPRRAHVVEVLDLDPTDRLALWQEVEQVAAALRATFAPDKLNIAALGNMVPQLHMHVIARFRADPAWPSPVWGAVPPLPYAAASQDERVVALREALISR